MTDYNPAVDGIGLGQLNTDLQQKLNECFQHIDEHGNEESLKQEIGNLHVQVRLIGEIVYALATDKVLDQYKIDRLGNLVR